MGLYIGVDGVARNVKSIYVGVGGVARKVAKGYIGVNGIARQFYSSGLPLSDLPEGSLVAINESGSPVLFYLAKHDYESDLNGAGRTLLVRMDCYDQRPINSVSSSNNTHNGFAGSDIDRWLNGDYKSLFSSSVQSAMESSKFYYTPGDGDWNVTTLERSIFILSCTEIGKTSDNYNVEGSALPTASTIGKAYANGKVVSYWARTPKKNSSTWGYGIGWQSFLGSISIGTYDYYSDDLWSRPCFTLPAGATVNPEPNADGSYTLTI